MKLSEQLTNSETERSKKRKRQSLTPDDKTVQNEDCTDIIRHSPKKNKTDSNAESGDKHLPGDNDIYNLDNQHDDKTNRDIKSDKLLKNKKTEESGSAELISSSTNHFGESSSLTCIQSVTDEVGVSPKKNRKQKNSTNQNCEKVDSTQLNANSFVVNYRNNVSQTIGSPKKKEKVNKINDENSNELSSPISSNSTDITDSNPILHSETAVVTDETCESNETIKRSPEKKKRKKNKLNTDSNESLSLSSSDADPNSHSVSDAVCEPSASTVNDLPRKLRKKKKKLDKNSNIAERSTNAFENTTTSDLQPNSLENVPAANSSAKPLKSCLKKKKRKNKKKKNLRSHDSSFEDEAKLGNRSVSFDSNVKIELIENCLSKSLAQEAKNTIVNDRKKTKALAYLKRWKEDRQNWKFEKLTQLWLLKNMFNQDLVPNDEFSLLLEYVVDLKGAARNLVNTLCGEIITKMEQKAPEEEDKELEAIYPRARSVQQYLQ